MNIRWIKLQRAILSAFLAAAACLTAESTRGDEPPRAFRVWAASCSHVPADIRRGRESLAEAIRQSEGKVAAAPAFASGIASVRDINGEAGQVICWAGDGGTYDIGLATLSAAAERDENLIYICYDNEIYGNTGGQRSSATPAGAKTTTTPSGKAEGKKDIMAIMAAHGVPYAATLSIAHPEDFARKIATALATRGLRFLLIHSPCPTGWKSEPADSVQLVRLAIASGLFPLYEVWDGRRYRINARPDWTDPEDYVTWVCRVNTPGTFQVEINYACTQPGGSPYVVEVADQRLEAEVESTGSWTNFETKKLGTVKLGEDRHILTVRAKDKVGEGVMNLKSIVLKPKSE